MGYATFKRILQARSQLPLSLNTSRPYHRTRSFLQYWADVYW